VRPVVISLRSCRGLPSDMASCARKRRDLAEEALRKCPPFSFPITVGEAVVGSAWLCKW
jgi:hypothetical protein